MPRPDLQWAQWPFAAQRSWLASMRTRACGEKHELKNTLITLRLHFKPEAHFNDCAGCNARCTRHRPNPTTQITTTETPTPSWWRRHFARILAAPWRRHFARWLPNIHDDDVSNNTPAETKRKTDRWHLNLTVATISWKTKNRTKKLKKIKVVYNGFIPNKMATKRRRWEKIRKTQWVFWQTTFGEQCGYTKSTDQRTKL